jgi:hypothetical protein
LHASGMPHERTRPCAVNLTVHRREIKAVGRAPTISNAAMATTPPSGGLDLFSARASNTHPRLKIP